MEENKKLNGFIDHLKDLIQHESTTAKFSTSLLAGEQLIILDNTILNERRVISKSLYETLTNEIGRN